jgi:GNAT superfamily N-acetyltransferase
MKISFIAEDDIEECNEFHNRAYGVRRTLSQWHWQFDRLLGGRRAFVVAKENGRVVGTQALMPIIMNDAKGDVLTAKSEETLVDSSMRGKGVFQKMYEPLMQLALSHGVKAIWGFTPAYKVFEGIGFIVPDRTSQLVYPLSGRAAVAFGDVLGGGFRRTAMMAAISMASVVSAARIAIASKNNHEIRLEILTHSPDQAEALCREFVHDWGGQTILRDKAYLQWRYYENPVVRATLLGAYRGDALVGWVAYSLDEQSLGYIVDAMVLRTHDVRQILRLLILQVVMKLRAGGAVAIRGWHLNNHPFDQLITEVARDLGFYLVRFGEPVVLYLSPNQDPQGTLSVWDDWYVSRAYTQGEAG